MPRINTKNSKPNAVTRAIAEFSAFPGNGRPATTTSPSIRNFIWNVKNAGSEIKKALTTKTDRRGRVLQSSDGKLKTP